MQTLLNLVMEPKAGIAVKKAHIDVGGKNVTVYEVALQLQHGPMTILLPESFAIGVKDKLIEAISSIVVPNSVPPVVN